MEIREIRKQKGLTQAEAAEICTLPLRTYQSYEYGESSNSFKSDYIKKILSSYERFSLHKGILPLDYIREALEKVFSNREVEFAYLFGSYATGKALPSSDVDLLVDCALGVKEYTYLCQELEKALHKKVDLITLPDLSSDSPLFREILKSGIRIYDKK